MTKMPEGKSGERLVYFFQMRSLQALVLLSQDRVIFFCRESEGRSYASIGIQGRRHFFVHGISIPGNKQK